MELIQGNKFCDDRGYVSFINDLDLSKYKRFYLVENHEKGFIRAWHGHKQESKAVVCLRGVALIGLNRIGSEDEPEMQVISSHNPRALIIPPGHYNGAKTLTDGCILMYLSDRTVEDSHGDDYRLPWDEWGEECWIAEYR